MLEFKNIELSDRDILKPYLYKQNYGICEFSFSNLYMWRTQYNAKYAIIDDCAVIMYEDSNFSPPCGDGDPFKALDAVREYAEAHNLQLQFVTVTPQFLELLNQWSGDKFDYECERDYSDYLYTSESLITLKGKKLHNKRNHINKFKSKYSYTFEELNDENLQEVINMHREWCELNDYVDDEELLSESGSVRDVLVNYKSLKVDCGVLRVDGKVVAFAIGESINQDVYDVTIEKAFYDVDGAYTMINQQFAEHFCSEYEYINREDDIGDEGLRQAKLSYRPAILLEKGLATYRDAHI